MRSVTQGDSTLLNTTVVGQPWSDRFKVGYGIDAITGQLRKSAVEPPELVPSKRQKTVYKYSLIESQEDLERLLETSVKGSYNIEGVKVSASTSFLEKVTTSELAVTIVAEISVEDTDYTLAKNYRLAVEPGPEFRKDYGDYFVAGYRAGSSLFAVYQCRFSSSSQRREFSAAVAADVPQVLSVEGSAKFQQVASAHSAQVSVDVVATGVEGTMPSPPDAGWTPGTVLSLVIPWFNDNLNAAPLDSYLMHYRLVDPTISGEVPVPPTVFADLSYLYARFWRARTRVLTCPTFGRRLVSDGFLRLQTDLEARQADLATDPDAVVQFLARVDEMLGVLGEIDNRQSFYSQVVKSAANEPPKDQRHDADTGALRWGYGIPRTTLPGVDVDALEQSYTDKPEPFGYRTKSFQYPNDPSRVIVGWDVICHYGDHGGDWEKRSTQIVGRSAGEVWVKSDFWRSTSWSVIWYTVPADLYPAGPWTALAVHGEDVTHVAADDGGDDYWTPERMRAAIPDDDVTDRTLSTVTPSVDPRRVPPSTVGDAQIAAPTTSKVPDPTTYPFRAVGKLFFTRDGQDRVASASAVQQSGILTAAHCLLRDGKTADRIRFVPAYDDGRAPFGIWKVTEWKVTRAWHESQSTAYDVGFGKVAAQPDGQELGGVVGYLGISARGSVQRWSDVGYPSRPTGTFPFDGKQQWQSVGSRLAGAEPGVVAKEDDLTAGGSGGPWLMVDDPAVVNGLFSKFNVDQRYVLSPEFGDWVVGFYREFFG